MPPPEKKVLALCIEFIYMYKYTYAKSIFEKSAGTSLNLLTKNKQKNKEFCHPGG